MKKQNSFVLLFALMLISIIIIMTEQLIRGVMVGVGFTKTMVDREHAQMLALGGINIAISQLTYDEKEKDKEKEKELAAPESAVIKPEAGATTQDQKITPQKRFFYKLISNLNRWQTFELDPKNYGITGTVKICVTSEHGKININNAFDFKKQEFKKEFKVLLAGLEIPGKFPAGEFFNKISEFLKKREKKLYDVTELLNISGLESLDAFYDPPRIYKKEGSHANENLALQDMFTTWTENEKIDPLLFSDALCALFNIRRPRADDAKKYKEKFRQLAMAFKDDWGKEWDANWKHLQNIYDSKPQQLSNIKDILVEKFNPKVYSVLSYGRVGTVEQRILAVIKQVQKKNKTSNKSEQGAEKGSTKDQQSPGQEPKEQKQESKVFKIERIYWL